MADIQGVKQKGSRVTIDLFAFDADKPNWLVANKNSSRRDRRRAGKLASKLPRRSEKALVSKGKGEPCKQGERADKTGCIPKESGSGGGPTGGQPKGNYAPAPPGEKIAPPPHPAHTHDPDPHKKDPQTGVTEAARVGVPGNSVPPPPRFIPRLPNLTERERAAESRFAEMYLNDPDGKARDYRRRQNHLIGYAIKAGSPELLKSAEQMGLKAKLDDKGKLTVNGERRQLEPFMEKHDLEGTALWEIGDAPNIFNTDDAKNLSPDYNPEDKAKLNEARGTFNAAVHQTANALAKRAFVQYLDEVVSKYPDGDPKRSVLVTSGGVAAGKGFALVNVDQTKSLAGRVGAIWDAAGEQNATENPWIMEECKKRGIQAIFAFVHANPNATWENPERGVVERANKIGRMVDARLFADSYSIGAKNFHAFHQKFKDSGDAEFFVLDNSKEGEKPTILDTVPEEALKLDADHLYAQATKVLQERAKQVQPYVLRGGTIGQRVWGKPKMTKKPSKPGGGIKNSLGV